MFDNLSERLERSFKILKGEGKITEINVAETLKDVRKALLDADVNYKVAKNFTDTVKEKALGQNVLTAVKPSQLMVKIVHDELTQLMGGETPTINGDGRQSRDFTYVENVVEANLKACQASSEAAGEAFNIGAGGREFLIDVYHNICKALNKEVEPNFGPDRKGDIRDSNADISKARELLGYDPDYDFARGIALAIDWYRENL